MCHQAVDLYLHCSHITIRAIYCRLNPQVEANLIPIGADNHAGRYSQYRSINIVEHCPNHTCADTHSYLLCCPSCRGRVEHATYEVLHGDQGEWAHDTKRICSRSDTKASTLPTCARLKMKSSSLLREQKPVVLHEELAATFPYGLGLNTNLQNDYHNPIHTKGTSESAVHIANSQLHFEIMENYLRFPLTKCHHLILFNMPQTFIDESCDNVLPCGCWTGRAPDAQMQEATLFVDYFGAETSFKRVWDVTGLGADGCWECGALEYEVGDENEARGDEVGNGNSYGHAVWAHTADGGTQRVDKETGKVMSIREAFLEDCEQWRKIEDWKDEWWDGDMVERGAKMVADSRWKTED